MPKFAEIAKTVEKFTIDNSPTILTVIGVTGTVTTAILTGRASFKAAELIAHEQTKENIRGHHQPLTTKDKMRLTWTLYIPAVGTGLLTCAATVGANQIGTRRAAAVAAAYTISERAFTEYKEKVVEKLGESKEQNIRDEVAQDRVTRNPVGDREVIVTGGGDVLCYDAFTGRYFMSDMETLKKAQNDINYQIINQEYASLSDFYNKIGIAPTAYSDEVGWNNDKLLELKLTGTLSEDQKPCISIDFAVSPVRDYYKLY